MECADDENWLIRSLVNASKGLILSFTEVGFLRRYCAVKLSSFLSLVVEC